MKTLKGVTVLESLVSIIILLIIVRLVFNFLWLEATRVDELKFVKTNLDYQGMFEQSTRGLGRVVASVSGAQVTCESNIYDKTNLLYVVNFEIVHKRKTETITLYLCKR